MVAPDTDLTLMHLLDVTLTENENIHTSMAKHLNWAMPIFLFVI
jgi:hypothetical protein